LAAGLAVLAVRIRKAMGASTGEILRLLLWQFTRPVLWANLIAWPAGYYAMSQ
jgi:putative ABC transport system permease protein